jgi:hypothetical protein
MENVDRAVAIAKMQRRLSARPVLSSKHVAITRSLYKSLMESGAGSLKMIAQQFWLVAESLSFQTLPNFVNPSKENPPWLPTGDFFLHV